jgi:large subunit ribosomal protein L35
MSSKKKLLYFLQVQVNKSDYDNVTGALPYLKVNRKAD